MIVDFKFDLYQHANHARSFGIFTFSFSMLEKIVYIFENAKKIEVKCLAEKIVSSIEINVPCEFISCSLIYFVSRKFTYLIFHQFQ